MSCLRCLLDPCGCEDEYADFTPYTGRDFLEDSLCQMQEMERVRIQWQAGFLADVARLREWETP